MKPQTDTRQCSRCFECPVETTMPEEFQQNPDRTQRSSLNEGAEAWRQALLDAFDTRQTQDKVVVKAMTSATEESASLLEIVPCALDGP